MMATSLNALRRIALATVAVAAAVLVLGCGEASERPPEPTHGAAPAAAITPAKPATAANATVSRRVAPKKVRGRAIVIGIDGASPRMVFPMIRQGKLPNLAAIAKQGVSGKIRSIKPISSPIIWNTVATGKSPSKHGITAFSRQDEAGAHHLFLSTDRKVHALWNIASEADLSVSVINMWNTYPPESVNGVMVSDHLLARQIEGRRGLTNAEPVPTGEVIYPTAWHGRLQDAINSDEQVAPGFQDPFKDNMDMPRWLTEKSPRGNLPTQQLSRRYQEDEALARIALEIEAEIRPDITMILLPGVDRISHFLWGFIEPDELYPAGLRAPAANKAEAARTLHYYYQFVDALVGALVASFSRDDLVIVVSDHGFEAGAEMMMLTGVHKGAKAIDGILLARGAGIAPGTRAKGVTVADVTPTVLAWLGFPIAADMDGKVASFISLPSAKPKRIATYDDREVERMTTAPSGVEADLVEQLRGLGYLE